MEVLLDTCTLINFAKEDALFHQHAASCMQKLSEQRHRLHISSLTLAEYGVKGDCSNFLNPKLFNVVHYGTQHALKAADFLKALHPHMLQLRDSEVNTRKVIAIDTLILAQAQIMGVDYVLTADGNTMAKTANALKRLGLFSPNVVLLCHSPLEKMGLVESSQLMLDFSPDNNGL